MQFTVDKNDLLTGIRAIEKVLPQKTTMPILKCIHLNADGMGLTLTASDLEITSRTNVSAFVGESGSICVDGSLFGKIISKMPNGSVSFQIDGNTIQLSCGRAKAELVCQATDDYPKALGRDASMDFEIPAEALSAAIDGVAFCADPNATQKTMQGVHFMAENGSIKLTALDGHRIGMCELQTTSSAVVDAIIPVKALRLASKIASSGNVSVGFTDRMVWFCTEDTELAVVLIEGKFFDVSAITKTDFPIGVTIAKEDFIGSIERAIAISEFRKPIVLDIAGNELNLSVRDAKGKINDKYDIEHHGDDLRIGFDPVFFSECLRFRDSDDVLIMFNSAKYPCKIYGNTGFEYIILPVNIGS